MRRRGSATGVSSETDIFLWAMTEFLADGFWQMARWRQPALPVVDYGRDEHGAQKH